MNLPKRTKNETVWNIDPVYPVEKTSIDWALTIHVILSVLNTIGLIVLLESFRRINS